MSKQVRPPDAIWNYSPGDSGMCLVIVFRYKPNAIHAGVFLIDRFCLGVKDAFFRILNDTQLLEFRSKYVGYEAVEVGCAKRLVDESIRYAAKFGFSPHEDYRKASTIFAEIPTCTHPHPFVFGQDGKPHYFAGPNDSPKFAQRVMAQLARSCGEGNYYYTVGGEIHPLGD